MEKLLPMTLGPKEIGQRIRRARRLAGLTQDELAAKLNLTKATVSKIECGYYESYSRKRIEALAVILNTSPAYLLGWDSKLAEPVLEAPDPIGNDRILKEIIAEYSKMDIRQQVKLLNYAIQLNEETN